MADTIVRSVKPTSSPPRQALDNALDPYLSLRALTEYSGFSIRSLRRALASRMHPLPHYRPSRNKILVRQSEFDRWMRQFRHAQEPVDLDSLINDTIRKLRP